MERVLILLANAENRSLLAQILVPTYEVAFEFPGGEPGTERQHDVDLCILDGSSLKRYGARLLAERIALDPVLLPVLLLSDRRSIGSMTRELWRAVDDVVLRPLEKLEMRARVDSLARAPSLAKITPCLRCVSRGTPRRTTLSTRGVAATITARAGARLQFVLSTGYG